MTGQPSQGARVLTAGLDMWKLSVRLAEVAAASHAVILTRMMMLGMGVIDQRSLPTAEFARLVPEKIGTFSAANASAFRILSGGSGPGSRPSPAWGQWAGDPTALLGALEQIIQATAAWWLPIHVKTRSNHRRLSSRRR